MTPEDALAELFARVGASSDAAVLVAQVELRRWPAAAVSAMKAQKLLAKAASPGTVVCPGCEQECPMPLHVVTSGESGRTAAFVVCDKRDDINRVPIPAELRTVWRCDVGRVCAFVAVSLGLRMPADRDENGPLRRVGMAKGNQRSQMLAVRVGRGSDLTLVVAENSLPLVDAVRFHDGRYAVDGEEVRRLVDAAKTADERHIPGTIRREAGKLATQDKYRAWQTAYRDLKRKRRGMSDVWYARQIVKDSPLPQPSVETVRRRMK